METIGVNDRERGRTAPGSFPKKPLTVSPVTDPTLSAMSVSELAAQCRREISNYGPEDQYRDASSVELFHRAIVYGNQEARACLQQCLSRLVQNWLHCHPRCEAAYLLGSEEHYVSQAFKQFWQVTAHIQKSEFSSLAVALQCLRASLNGVILDTLRASSRPRDVPFPETNEPGELHVEEAISSFEVWETLSSMLPEAHEQRLAYLLFHCGLSPKEILRCCPQEFADVGEIYHLWHTITERVLSNADQLSWQLAMDEER